MNRAEASRAAAKKAAQMTNRIKALKKQGMSHETAKLKAKHESLCPQSNVVLPEKILEYGMMPNGKIINVEEPYNAGLISRNEVVDAKRKYRALFSIDTVTLFMEGCGRIIDDYAQGHITKDEAIFNLTKAAINIYSL